MYLKTLLKCAIVLIGGLLLWRGLVTFKQTRDEAFIREPGHIFFDPAVPAFDSARQLCEYAVLCARVYQGTWGLSGQDAGAVSSTGTLNPPGSLPLNGWVLWPDFPSQDFKNAATAQGLYCEVWESTADPVNTVAVVFKGTDFNSAGDWESNLRWVTRFIPGYQDQYTLLSKRLGFEFVDTVAQRKPDTVRFVATGHSLGGGLAQNFAYSLPLKSSRGVATARISHVYAFDPSPVTGWFSVDPELREHNARGLKIDRVYEKGEVLAYVRALMRGMYIFASKDPAIREIRFNFVRSVNIIKSHSMSMMAQSLLKAAEKH